MRNMVYGGDQCVKLSDEGEEEMQISITLMVLTENL